MKFCIEQYKDGGHHIYYQFHVLRVKSYRWGFILIQYFVWSRLVHFGVTFGLRLRHF